jgi:hypothetical protein
VIAALSGCARGNEGKLTPRIEPCFGSPFDRRPGVSQVLPVLLEAACHNVRVNGWEQLVGEPSGDSLAKLLRIAFLVRQQYCRDSELFCQTTKMVSGHRESIVAGSHTSECVFRPFEVLG